jgi:TPP-dependent 2-oxoacid decarboxylase
MNSRVRRTETSGTVKAISVADYIVERLAAEGIDHCFGVAGDYVFSICDAVDSSTKVKWIGCSNELNASYAADGYARVRGAAMLATTYGVGELSPLNGVMGAKAEKSLVFHVVGMPSYQNQRLGKIAHHTLGDGVYGNFVNLSASAACCHAVIGPENCVIEMERVIAEARRNNQPAYIAVPSDYARSPVVTADVKPLMARSNTKRCRRRLRPSQSVSRMQNPSSRFRPSQLRGSVCKNRHRRQSRRWAVLLSRRSWKNVSSTKGIRSLPASTSVGCQNRKRAKSSTALISSSTWAASI